MAENFVRHVKNKAQSDTGVTLGIIIPSIRNLRPLLLSWKLAS